jgi:fructose-1-phosphate kinase PfkB-like protein
MVNHLGSRSHTLVLALNPSIDAEWRVTDVLWEEKNNVQSERRWAGGKGINVARWLKHLGDKPLLLLPLGGQPGDELAGYLRAERLPAQIIRLREATRVNIIVTTDAGRQMRFNPLGPKLTAAEWQSLLAVVRRALRQMQASFVAPRAPHPGPLPIGWVEGGPAVAGSGEGVLILSGSLPQGVPVDAYAQLIRLADRAGVRTLLDCDGPALAAAVKARPFLVKPNEHELAQWWGKPLRTEPGIVRAARSLSAQTGGWVLVSRGGERSLLVNETAQFKKFAAPRRVKPRNTVGAGDALLAAVAQAIQTGLEPEEWLRRGLETGTAATQLQPGELP